MATIIDGKARAEKILESVKFEVQNLGFTPRLAIFLASNDESSRVFVNLKMKKAESVGIEAKLYEFPEDITTEDLEREISRVKSNSGVNGALIQLPLYSHIDGNTNELLNKLVYTKDADGLTAINQGRSSYFLKGSIPPATVEAVLECLDIVKHENFTWYTLTESSFKIKPLVGENVLIINNSNLIGKPLAQILSTLGATVTIANKTTKDIKSFTEKADIIISATGQTNIIDHTMIKEGSILIDVTSEKRDGKYVGDFIQSEELWNKAGAITPVPGGVGPLTVACLLRNVVRLSGGNIGGY